MNETMKHPTRDDVAKLASVSGATVSRVLSGRDDLSISDETRRRVLESVQLLGYRTNYSARALASGQTNMVALWSNHLDTPFHSQVAHIIGFKQKPSRYRLLITELEGLHAQHFEEAHSQFVDGLIVHESPDRVADLMKSFPRMRLPIVTIGAAVLDSTDHVEIDLLTGQVEAVRHLYSIGCRRIAYLVNEDATRLSESRTKGYEDVMKEAGLPPQYVLTPVNDQTRSAARQVVRDYAERHGHPDAIICLNDDMAIGANRALRDLNLRVPEDVCIVGCDGIEETIYQTPTLTTIVQPIEEMCRLAWDQLVARLANPDGPPQHARLEAHLVIRES